MQKLKFFLIGFLGSWVLRALLFTVRVRTERLDLEDEIHARGEQVIYAFWHGRMLLPAWTHRNRKIHVMLSMSKDGEMMARILRRMGFRSVRGSTSRGGVRAMVEMARIAKNGFDCAFTPDGPRGPRYKVQGGVMALARLTGFPIVPSGLDFSRYKQLGSWDEFRIPRPFCRAAVVLGEPVYVRGKVPANEEVALRLEIERRIQVASARATALARGETVTAASEE